MGYSWVIYMYHRYPFPGRPIKIEIIKDEDDKAQAPGPTAPPSLLQRLAPAPTQRMPASVATAPPAKTCVVIQKYVGYQR